MIAGWRRVTVALGKDYTPLYKENNMLFHAPWLSRCGRSHLKGTLVLRALPRRTVHSESEEHTKHDAGEVPEGWKERLDSENTWRSNFLLVKKC